MRGSTHQHRRPRSRAAPLASAALGLGGLLLISRLTHADQPARFELAYEAPATCPSRERFAQELRFRTSKIVFDDTSELHGKIALRVEESRGRYAGTLVLTVDGATESRSVSGPRCESVVSALGLAAAILVDPAANAAPLPEAIPAIEPSPVDAGPPDAATDASAPTETPPPDASTAPPPPLPAPEPQSRLAWSAEIGAGATTAIHDLDPLLVLGAGVEAVRARRRLWAAHLRLFASLDHDVSANAGTITYRTYGGRLDGCPLVGTLEAIDLDLDACAFVSLLVVPVGAPSAPIEHAQVRALFSPGAVGRAVLHFGRASSFGLALDVGAGIHPVQEQFLIDPRGEVFRLPRVYSFGALGLVLTFP